MEGGTKGRTSGVVVKTVTTRGAGGQRDVVTIGTSEAHPGWGW